MSAASAISRGGRVLCSCAGWRAVGPRCAVGAARRALMTPLAPRAWAATAPGVRHFADVLFTDTHEWIRVEEPGLGTVGISEFAQEKLGEVQLLELPEVGAKFSKKDEMCSIESVKTISAANAVCDCEIVAVNTALETKPELINSSPEGEGWIVKVKFSGDLAEHTMSRKAYDDGTADGSIPP